MAVKAPVFSKKVSETTLAGDENHIFSPKTNTVILKPRLWTQTELESNTRSDISGTIYKLGIEVSKTQFSCV